jgi:hypothetical protein
VEIRLSVFPTLAKSSNRDYSGSMKSVAVAAVLLLITWVVLRVALAITSGLLHLLWIAAIIMGVMWVWNKVTGKSRG